MASTFFLEFLAINSCLPLYVSLEKFDAWIISLPLCIYFCLEALSNFSWSLKSTLLDLSQSSEFQTSFPKCMVEHFDKIFFSLENFLKYIFKYISTFSQIYIYIKLYTNWIFFALLLDYFLSDPFKFFFPIFTLLVIPYNHLILFFLRHCNFCLFLRFFFFFNFCFKCIILLLVIFHFCF